MTATSLAGSIPVLLGMIAVLIVGLVTGRTGEGSPPNVPFAPAEPQEPGPGHHRP